MVPTVTPQLVANNGITALRAAIADPDRYVVEPKVDGVRGLVVYREDRTVETRNRDGVRRRPIEMAPAPVGHRRELRLIFGVIIAAILIWAVLSGFVLVHNAALVTG